jgi:ankyrin repeat protein
MNELSTIALCILNNIERCNLPHVNNYGETALTISCRFLDEDVIMKILEYPDKCNMGHITTRETRNDSNDPYYKKYSNYYSWNGDRIDSFYETALTLACKYKLNKSALKMLDYPKLCNIYAISRIRENIDIYTEYNSLLWACINKLSEVALKILDYPQEEFYKKSNLYQNAFEHSCKNNMEDVAIKFMDKSNKLLKINNEVLSWLDKNKMDNAIDFYIRLSFNYDIL